MADGIKTFRQDFGDKVGPGYVVHSGDIELPLAPNVVALPFARL